MARVEQLSSFVIILNHASLRRILVPVIWQNFSVMFLCGFCLCDTSLIFISVSVLCVAPLSYVDCLISWTGCWFIAVSLVSLFLLGRLSSLLAESLATCDTDRDLDFLIVSLCSSLLSSLTEQ